MSISETVSPEDEPPSEGIVSLLEKQPEAKTGKEGNSIISILQERSD